MPIQVYNFNLRGNGLSGNIRMESKEKAHELYEQISAGLKSGDEFIEIIQGEEVNQIRARDISAFGINVVLEQTQEEIKQMQIQQIESQYAGNGYPNTGYATDGYQSKNLCLGSNRLF